ncbi:oxidoreductase [Paenibacillus polysaccharolyticus]|uniref:oxidoreductase n=1 Tax=Paenibacillus polysaccharolyticus TaxID=582692 RepID=UPI0020A02714|nr:oxidoreductase [Paenibacillus polysaccharolyticus]MCP1133627.1 oxidoreductase [Paenibacillus polysaccharolyticus]
MSKQHWDATKIPDQQGKVIIVTGSTSGLGKEAVKTIAGKNAKVIMAVRNVDKGKEVANELKKEIKHADIDVRKLDLANLSSIRAFANVMVENYDRLDILINNAGIMFPPYSKTVDGFENQFGTNHLGHFALTGLLMPLLKKTEGSRIVVLSSLGHTMGKLDFEDLNWEARKYDTQKAYGDSKLANLYFTYELARRLKREGDHPRITAAHPGWTATDLQRNSAFMSGMNRFFAQRVHMGVLPTLRAAFDEEAKAGDFFGPSKLMNMRGYPVAHSSNKLSYDEGIARELWQRSEEMTGIKF